MRPHVAVVRTVVAIAVTLVLAAGAVADPGARGKAGACAAFVKRVVEADAEGISRPDLYDGVSGWIAKKVGLDPSEIDGLAMAEQPDALACDAFAIPAAPLRTLEGVAKSVPAEKLRLSLATCLADLRLLDELADGPRQTALRALDAEQARTVGKLMALVARDVKPPAGAVEEQIGALRGSRDPREAALGAGLAACEPLGVDVGRLRHAHAGR